MKLFRTWLVMCLPLLLGERAVMARLTLSQVTTVNVTPSSFSLVGECSSAIDSSTTVSVSVFADAGGVTNLTGQLGLEAYPLLTGSPGTTNAYDRRLNQAALRQSSMGLGLVYQRVSGCSPGTTYYYRLQVAPTNGPPAVWPTNGPLPAVTTLLENAFVLQSEQVVITLGEASPGGSIILLANTNTPSILAAVVGDGAGTNQAFFSINDLLAAAGDTNTLPIGQEAFTATVVGPPALGVTQGFTLNFTGTFVVGAEAQLNLGSFVALALGSNVVMAGQGGSIPIRLQAATFLTNFSFTLMVPTNRFSSLSLQPLVGQLGVASLTPVGSNVLQAVLTAAPGQSLLGNQPVAQLNFVTTSNQTSAFVGLAPENLAGSNTDASAVSQTAVQAGRLVIVGSQSLLEALRAPGGGRDLALYGRPGTNYQLQYSTNLAAAHWTTLMRMTVTNLEEVFPVSTSAPVVFYRALEFVTSPPNIVLTLGTNAVLVGQGGSIPIDLQATTLLTNLSFTLSLPTNHFSTLSLQALAPQIAVSSFGSVGPDTFQVGFVAGSGQNLLGTRRLGQVNFVTAPNQASAFVPFTPQSVQGTNTDASALGQVAVQSGQLAIVGQQSLLEALLTPGGGRELALYGRPGASYQLQYSTNLSKAGNWTSLMRVPLTNILELFPLHNAPPAIFYRAYEFTSAQPSLDIEPPVNGLITLVIYGTPWQAYELDSANGLTLNGTPAWRVLARFPFTNSFELFKINPTGAAMFYQATALSPDPPLLEAHLDSLGRSVLVYGRAGTNYVLQSATNISSPTWTPALAYTLTNSFQLLTNLGNAQRIFYRIKRP